MRLQTLGALALRDTNGNELSRRRMDLALLTALVYRSPSPVAREQLQADFWGESTEEKARHSLRQVIHRLRQACGDAIEVTPTSVRVRGGEIEVDALLFAEAVSQERWRDALGLWTGSFLPTCEDVGVDGFRTWLEVQRERLRQLLLHAFEQAFAEASPADATQIARRWASTFPLDATAHELLVRQLAAEGSIADASAERAAFMRRLGAELDEAPDDAWLASTQTAIDDAAPHVAKLLPARTVDVDPSTSARVAPPTISSGGRARLIGRRTLVATLAATIALIAVGMRIAGARPGIPPTIAIGTIRSTLPIDTLHGFLTLLNVDLGRVPALNVVTERRMSEVAGSRTGVGADSIARLAGAHEIIDGILSRRGNVIRADLQRIDLTTGQSRSSYSVESRDLGELADLITERVARDLGVEVRLDRSEGATTSILAYRAYEHGLHELSNGHWDIAHEDFMEAWRQDTGFAMAALYAARTSRNDSLDARYERAMQLGQRASDRERLLISTHWAVHTADPRARAWAESLVARFPLEPDGHLEYARQLRMRGNLLRARTHYRRALELDAAGVSAGRLCYACTALIGLVTVNTALDSLDAADSAARALVNRYPKSSDAWWSLAGTSAARNRFADAHRYSDSAAKYDNDLTPVGKHSVWWFYENNFGPLDSAWRELLATGTRDAKQSARWTGFVSMHTQGRMREALELARQYRRDSRNASVWNSEDPLLEAVAYLDGGAPLRAGLLFDSLALRPQLTERLSTRQRFSHSLRAASAYAEARDERSLERMEARMRPDATTDVTQLQLRYVTGLRYAVRGEHARAVEELSAAVAGRRELYVRMYLDLARSLLALNRGSEAIWPLRVALAGPTSAAGLYASRSELQALLGAAYDQSQQRDSAAKYYGLAVRAWRKADPPYQAKRDSLNRRLVALAR